MIISCKHFEDGRQVPCPPMCPVQEWPRMMFRRTWLGFGRHWKLRRNGPSAGTAAGNDLDADGPHPS